MYRISYEIRFEKSAPITGTAETAGGEWRFAPELPQDKIVSARAEIPLITAEDERIFINGYQTWTFCPEYTRRDKLPGVGRKTANVVCAVIWNQPTMAVDTHIFRVSERLGLTTGSKSPLQTEKQLTKYIPAPVIPKAHHWLLLHGRYVCQARTPHCNRCGLAPYCRYYAKKYL